MAQTVTSVRRCQPRSRARRFTAARPPWRRCVPARAATRSERRRPVSMSTVTLMPARSRRISCPASKAMRTGTRCTTFTQLPMAFCGGRIANCAPVPGLTELTVPWKAVVRERVDVDRDLLSDPQIGDVGFLRIGVDPGRGVVDDAEDRRAGRHEAAELDIVDLRGGAGDRRLQRRCGRGRAAPDRAPPWPAGRAGYCSIGRSGLPSSCVERGGLLLRAPIAACSCAVTIADIECVEVRLRPARLREQRGLALDVLLLELDVLLRELDQPGRAI